MTAPKTLKEQVERILPRVIKPARYFGNELNVIRKNPDRQRVKVCLAFPDVYDIGQSYMGFYILYHILNKRDGTLCERAFAPWPDMEKIMREEGVPLWSLESCLPVSAFDVVGFTLQYELHYTTVLNMLDLAGIPLEAGERSGGHPLVIGGGPCCVNPEPAADFFDALLLGDGEEAFPEMLDRIEESRRKGKSRAETLESLSSAEGVYVPSLYRERYRADGAFAGMEPVSASAAMPVKSRTVETLKPEHYPDRPLMPAVEVVHDRLAVEIMRGCSRGCRFCNAGMSYRPRRVRPVEDIIRQVVNGIKATGWDDVSLVSLSDSDYPGLEEVVKCIGSELKGKAVTISLSSLRADNFSVAMADAAAGGKKTSLTFAVEAATQRLRDVINKNLTEEQLLETLTVALEGGWQGFKLYFMIGLPTETDEDVIAIAKLLNTIGGLIKKYHGRQINVTVSAFCPKPMTPFQWGNQDSVETLTLKFYLIKKNLRSRLINLKPANFQVSMLENQLGRGSRRMKRVILEAWKRGCWLDSWSEHFKGAVWRQALEETGITMENGGGGSNPGSPLPWSHLSYGIDEAYLLEECGRAQRGEPTADCAETCHSCGPYAALCRSLKETYSSADFHHPIVHSITKSAEREMRYGRKPKAAAARSAPVAGLGTRVRMKFAKNGWSRFIGHLDMIRMFDRTFRRSDIPVAYTQGFHPHPKISFGYPLPHGIKSIAEYVDFSMRVVYPEIEAALRKGLPEEFSLVGIRAIPDKAESLNQIVKYAEYYIHCPVDDTLVRAVGDILSRDSILAERVTKKGPATVNIRPGIISMKIADDREGFIMLLGLEQERAAKPSEVLKTVFGADVPDDITRTEQYAVLNGEMVSPLDILL